MFHKIKAIRAFPDFELIVEFSDGAIKQYNAAPLLNKLPSFRHFIERPEDFLFATVDTGGYGIAWNDGLDLSSDELWENGVEVDAPHSRPDGSTLVSDNLC